MAGCVGGRAGGRAGGRRRHAPQPTRGAAARPATGGGRHLPHRPASTQRQGEVEPAGGCGGSVAVPLAGLRREHTCVAGEERAGERWRGAEDACQGGGGGASRGRWAGRPGWGFLLPRSLSGGGGGGRAKTYLEDDGAPGVGSSERADRVCWSRSCWVGAGCARGAAGGRESHVGGRARGGRWSAPCSTCQPHGTVARAACGRREQQRRRRAAASGRHG